MLLADKRHIEPAFVSGTFSRATLLPPSAAVGAGRWTLTITVTTAILTDLRRPRTASSMAWTHPGGPTDRVQPAARPVRTASLHRATLTVPSDRRGARTGPWTPRLAGVTRWPMWVFKWRKRLFPSAGDLETVAVVRRSPSVRPIGVGGTAVEGQIQWRVTLLLRGERDGRGRAAASSSRRAGAALGVRRGGAAGTPRKMSRRCPPPIPRAARCSASPKARVAARPAPIRPRPSSR